MILMMLMVSRLVLLWSTSSRATYVKMLNALARLQRVPACRATGPAVDNSFMWLGMCQIYLQQQQHLTQFTITKLLWYYLNE